MPYRGGVLFALGLLAMVLGLALHPPESYDAATQMRDVAASEGAWRGAHAALAAFPLAFALGAALLVPATAGARRLAWALVACGGLVATGGFLVEATATPTVAAAGDLVAFRAWSGFSAALLVPAAGIPLGVALVAVMDARVATTRAARAIGYATALLSLAGAVGVVGDSLHVAVLGQLLPLSFAGVLYAAVGGVRAALGRGAPTLTQARPAP